MHTHPSHTHTHTHTEHIPILWSSYTMETEQLVRLTNMSVPTTLALAKYVLIPNWKLNWKPV